MKLLYTVKYLLVCAASLAFSRPCCGADRFPTTLADDWAKTKREDAISGTYENRCSVASQVGSSYTSLLLLVLGESTMGTAKTKSAVKSVKITQEARKITIAAEDVDGNTVIARVLEEGRDYHFESSKVAIASKWDASDEWSSGKGISVNRFQGRGRILTSQISHHCSWPDPFVSHTKRSDILI